MSGNSNEGITRRDLLKTSGLAIGGLAAGGTIAGAADDILQCGPNACGYPVPKDQTMRYDYPLTLPDFSEQMQQNLDEDEMRITFLGTNFPPARRTQQLMSIFVEVGPWEKGPLDGWGKAKDSFVFDIGPGTANNYGAMGISYGRMDKIFITHLHGDHMGDLPCVYCFGPAEDRKTPLYVWGQSPSGVLSPAWGTNPARKYQDGVNSFCSHMRDAMRWHSESFSFLKTTVGPDNYEVPTKDSWGLPCDPVPVSDDPPYDGFAMVPIELDWKSVGVAYDNPKTGVKITHFPVIHCRKGSMGYKVEWNGISMVYSSDTRPETVSIDMAAGADVFIHEMILPPEILTMKNMGITAPDWNDPKFVLGVHMAKTVEESSHTPQGAYGYLLSQINPRPRLAVLAHFPAANDTVACALQSVRNHFPGEDYPVEGRDIIWASDYMVLRVKKGGNIRQYRTLVDRYGFQPHMNVPLKLATSKYHDDNNRMDPTAQLDLSTFIRPGPDTYCKDGY
ncbi:MAG: MBL fold metallo-hydrolase [Acidobacteriota bacterium]